MMSDRSSKRTGRIFGSTAISFATHLLGTLTCATCWAIFGPALVLLFGTSGIAFLEALRPFAPLGLAVSAFGLGYSFYQLSKMRGSSGPLAFRLAGVFTILAAIGWAGSAAYTIATVIRG